MDTAPRLCKVCSSPRPAGRIAYCSDDCAAIGGAQRTAIRQQKRMEACKRCGGAKELGTRGGKYCKECRQVIADSSAHFEYERGRRRHLKAVSERVGRIKSRRVDCPPGQKWCARCQAFRHLSSFTIRGDGRPAPYCKPCQRSYNQERRIRLKFGITWEEYELLFDAQGGRCAICEGKPRKHLLAVDHDHNTGEIRGLLCSRCNHRLLGSANDDPQRLRKAAAYLEAFAPRATLGGQRFVPTGMAEAGR